MHIYQYPYNDKRPAVAANGFQRNGLSHQISLLQYCGYENRPIPASTMPAEIFLHRADDIRNSPMRTGAQNRHFISLLQHQCQFIRKSISFFSPFRQREEVFKMRIALIRNGQLRKNKHPGAQLGDLVYKTEARTIQRIRMQHAVFTFFFELRNEKFFLTDYLSRPVHSEKVMQPACMSRCPCDSTKKSTSFKSIQVSGHCA